MRKRRWTVPPLRGRDLHCKSRHITLILDLKAAYNHLRRRQSWIFRSLTADWDERLHRRLAV